MTKAVLYCHGIPNEIKKGDYLTLDEKGTVRLIRFHVCAEALRLNGDDRLLVEANFNDLKRVAELISALTKLEYTQMNGVLFKAPYFKFC